MTIEVDTSVVRGGGEAPGGLAAIHEEELNGWTYVHDADDDPDDPAVGNR